MKKHSLKIVLFALLTLGVVSCKDEKNQQVLTKEIPFTKEGTLSLVRSTNDSLIATLDIEIAEGDYETATGLMYRNSMRDDQAMLFIFERESPLSFYMKNTQFPLDIIYLNKALQIVEVHRDAKPFDPTPLPSGRPAKYVLEVNAGLVAKWKLLPIDRAEFSRINP
ncbi:MAG TPA: hypothetical protein DCZ44_03985 [Flavobacteriaceae bacterium]|nr:hypothetical protein [Flavobacteriaceae bacterium]